MSDPAFRSTEATTALPWRRLGDYLEGQGFAFALDPAPRQFAAGMGNLNYLITLDGSLAVLRRPPVGPIPPGANDMGREHKVLSRLYRRFPLAPRSFHFCGDETVIGAPFQIMEYRESKAIGGSTMPKGLVGDAASARALCEMMVRILADLHAVSAEDVGLGDFGRPDGFVERAIAGWSKRAAIAMDDAPSTVLDEIGIWLRDQRVPSAEPTLLHNDFKLDNILLAKSFEEKGAKFEPVAVLDWDQATRGDPLFDLATLTSYWTEAGDPPAMHELDQMPTAARGMLTRNEAVALYGTLTGRDVSDFLFYRVLAMFKLVVIFLQLHAQYRRGTVSDSRYEPFERIGLGIAEFALDAAHGRA